MRKTFVVELTKDVPNPDVDRRRNDWAYQPVLSKGARFVVLEHDEASVSDIKYKTQTIRKANAHGSVYGRTELGKAIMAASVEVEPKTAAEFVHVYDCINCEQVVRILLDKGRITADDFALVHDVLIDEDEEEERTA